MKETLLDCDKDNLASSKTMLAFDAKLIKEFYDDLYEHCIVQDYLIDIDLAICKYKDQYEPIIDENLYYE